MIELAVIIQKYFKIIKTTSKLESNAEKVCEPQTEYRLDKLLLDGVQGKYVERLVMPLSWIAETSKEKGATCRP